MFILTLMRLSVSATFLSCEFSVSESTVSGMFFEVIDVMYIRMKPLVFLPEREELRKQYQCNFESALGQNVL